MIEDFLPYIYSFLGVLISIAIAQLVILLDVYKDFEDVFSIKNAGYLVLYKDYNHAIDLIDDCQQLYWHFYSLSEKKFSIYQVFIDKNLINRFIRLSKSSDNTLILFIPKPYRDLQLCVDYWDLNNLIIKN